MTDCEYIEAAVDAAIELSRSTDGAPVLVADLTAIMYWH